MQSREETYMGAVRYNQQIASLTGAVERRTTRGVKSPEYILKETFGFDSFRPLQREVIQHVLDRRDTLAVMPTGGGKSLCYQIPALTFAGLTVVVSPLIALMKDQVEQMHSLGIPALFLNSSLDGAEYRQRMDAVRSGNARLMLVAPETLLLPHIIELITSRGMDFLVIDEAHCISEWGHDFRPEYRQLTGFRKRFPAAACLALTATATPRVRSDITTSLGFPESNTVVASFNRPNLFIEVAPKHDALGQVEQFLRRFKDQSGIIYCFSRKQVDDLAENLLRRGHAARPYHAGLDDSVRRSNQEAFIRDDVQIIVATIAFGMGINKPNVRFVIHYDLPKSIEGYYQEIGRAGRDGLPAHCLLLYTYADVMKLRYFIDQKTGEERDVAERHLQAILRYAEDGVQCRRRPLLAYFGEQFAEASCGACDNCQTKTGEQQDITIHAQKFLSCVHRTGGRFGVAHIVDVLAGANNEKVRKNGHDQLSTFGIGKDLDASQWRHLAAQLIASGHLEQEPQYRTLRLTEKAMAELRSRAAFHGVLPPAAAAKRKTRMAAELDGVDDELFELLRRKRKELADSAGVPPYVVFSDRTLVEMSLRFPQSEDSLARISGVGHAKLRTYGKIFLDVICAYCAEKGRQEFFDESAKPPPVERKKGASSRSVLVGDAFNQGATIQELAFQFDIEVATILSHLEKYHAAGNVLRPAKELEQELNLTPDQRARSEAAFATHGTAALKPVFEALQGEVSYDQLKLIRFMLSTASAR